MRKAIDDSEWPIVRITVPDPMTDEAWDGAITAFRELVGRREPMGFLTLPGGAAPNAIQRRKMADFMTECEADLRRYVVWALVIDSVMVRGAITAIKWIKPPPFKHELFAKLPEAEAWLTRELRLLRGS